MKRFSAAVLATLALLGSSTVMVLACTCAPRLASSSHCCCGRRPSAGDAEATLRRPPCCASEVAVRQPAPVSHDDFSPRVAPAPLVFSDDDAGASHASRALAMIANGPARAPPIAIGPPLYLRLSSLRC